MKNKIQITNSNFVDFMLWLKEQWGLEDYTESIHYVIQSPHKYQSEYDLFLGDPNTDHDMEYDLNGVPRLA